VNVVASTEIDSGGADWTHHRALEGHYCRDGPPEARQNDDYTFARWRSLQSAT
jgi:hypothetical protein